MKLLALGVLIGSVLAFALAASGAAPHRPSSHSEPLVTPYIHWGNWLAGETNELRADRCLSRLEFKPMWEFSEGLRRYVVRQRLEKRADARKEESRCIPWWPWGALAECESGGRWDYNGSSGFDGGLQFLPSTWRTARSLVRGASVYAYAYQAPAIVQVRVAQAWLARTSWSQWPVCSRKLGLR
jgi:hypothetical protein